MKKNRIYAAIASLCLLSGCTRADTSQSDGSSTGFVETGYVDTSKLFEKIDESQLDIGFTDYKYDDKSISFLGSNYAVTEDYLYIIKHNDKSRINLKNGRVQSICDIAGCIHDENKSPFCKEFEIFCPVFASAEGMYISKLDGKLYIRNGDGDTKVFENDFYTDLEAQITPDEKASFQALARDGIMYVVVGSYMHTVELSSMEKLSEPLVISDSFIQNADVSGEYFWFSNENMELKLYNMSSGEIVKTDDKVLRVKCAGNKVYYIKSSDNILGLYSRDIDGGNEILLVNNVKNEFSVTDNSIYYITEDGLFMCDIDGKNTRAIELSYTYLNGEKYRYHGAASCKFIENSACDSVFLIDYTSFITGTSTANALFAIKKDTGEYQAVSLGIWDTNGEVVTY